MTDTGTRNVPVLATMAPGWMTPPDFARQPQEPAALRATVLELGKLSAVAYLSQRYSALPLRLALVTPVGALMVLNSIGV